MNIPESQNLFPEQHIYNRDFGAGSHAACWQWGPLSLLLNGVAMAFDIQFGYNHQLYLVVGKGLICVDWNALVKGYLRHSRVVITRIWESDCCCWEPWIHWSKTSWRVITKRAYLVAYNDTLTSSHWKAEKAKGSHPELNYKGNGASTQI